MRILLLLAAIAAASQAQSDCSRGACYPPFNDLLLGRSHQLHASSTCGLTEAEVYCTPYQQRRMKCCPCDSRNPNSQLAHTMRDALSTSGPDRWWQSIKEVNQVSLQLDMGNLFQLDNLELSFKGPRPSAFVIERTLDNGRSWQPALYLATDCQRTFPGIPTRTPLTLDDTYCYTLPPTGADPYQDHKIEFSPLRQYAYVPATKSQKIEDTSGLTGLRVRFTELGDVPRPPGRALSRFYALKEMRVMGSCMCHGHANRCLPDTSNNLPSDSIQVHPQCDCQHNTVGVNCERCADLFVDLPWRPAEEGNTHTCKRCECNNHAQRCHFDQAVYEASGWRSGGVCEGCMHHTTGPKCDECAPGYQPNPRSQMDRPDACIRCVCSTEGTVNGGRCDDRTGSCPCKVNVEGPQCDRCKIGYYDLSPSNPLGCSSCECNNHAQRCHFDQAVYEASGRRSGGVCEGCMDHTTGPKCDKCVPGYQPNPRSQMDRPDACIRCVCDAEGTVSGGQCDDRTGSCPCKVNVEGTRCDRCKIGYYDLSPSNPLGCSKCSCSTDGSESNICDPITGQCPCRSHFHGVKCEVCSKGYWKPSLSGRCQPCGCDPTRSYSDTCDQVTGQCQCRPGFGGLTCTECPENAYGDPLIGCRPCRCDAEGTLPEFCDKQTGACLCRPGVNGTRCDSCNRGHCDSFPGCETCPSCFFTLDAQRQNLSFALERLSLKLPSRPGGGDLGNFEPRIRVLETSLKLIQDSITLPPSAAKQIDDALSQLDKLGDQVDKINKDLSPLEKDPGLESELDRLRALLASLTLIYKAKNDAKDNSVSPDDSGSLAAIKDAYDESADAAKKVDASGKPVKESADIREETTDLQKQIQPGNTRDLNKLNQSMASRPNLTPVAKQVCGSVRTEPCTPLQCAGRDLCPPAGTPPCKKGEACVGALPLTKRADADTKDVRDLLAKLSGKITGAVEKLQETQDTTNQVRQSTGKLSDKIKKARDELKDDLKETSDVVKELKDFLSDPSSNLTHVQEVSDWILKAKPLLSLTALNKKLEELKNLASSLPDSTSVLEEAEPQLDTARKQLEKAKEARDTALGVKDDVDGLLDGFNTVEGSLTDLKDKLQDSVDLIDDLNDNLTEAKKQLSPAEKALDDAEKLITPMKPQLDELKDLLEDGDQLAQDAQDNADDAEDEATAANKDLLTLEKQLDRLKDEAPAGGSGGVTVPLGDRVEKLKKDAGDLANTTDDMTKALEGKADSLRGLKDEFETKSATLAGLEADLREYLKILRKKAKDLSDCRG